MIGSLPVWLVALLPAGGCAGPTAPTGPTGPTAPEATPPAAAADPPWFEEVTAELGLDFHNDAGTPDDSYFLPQIIGAGGALFDFDGDGRLDIYLLNHAGPNGRPNQLFQQLPDGRFKNVSAGSGLDYAAVCHGVAVGDVNNDGWPDLVVTEYLGVRLFLNNGNGTFRDVTGPAGLKNPQWATSAAFLDYDRDGWLDLVIVNYVEFDRSHPCTSANGRRDYCNPNTFPGTVSRLFRNRGPRPDDRATVAFEDVTTRAGLDSRTGPGLGVVCADFTGDGWPDVFIANDGKGNHLWVNQKDGTFKEEGALRNVAYNAMGRAEGNMGIAWGDIDGDGLQDLFVTHLITETNTVWRQGPRGVFQDRTATTGLHRPAERATGFGTVLADFDCDGAPDVVVLNGAVLRNTPSASASAGASFWDQYRQRNQLFVNDGRGRFRDVSAANAGPKGLCGFPTLGRGLAVGDVSNQGQIWLLATEIAGPARLFRCVAPRNGRWLVVRAYDPDLKRDALGADITIRAGNRTWVRTVQSSGGYLTASDPRVHFGFGAIDRLDSVHVVWPDGTAELFPPPDLDRHVELRKGSGSPAVPQP